MSLLFFDGFDGYDSGADVVTFGVWKDINSDNGISSTVRTGTGKSVAILSGGTRGISKNFSADQISNTVVIGFALYFDATPTSTGQFLAFLAGTSNTGNTHCSLQYNATSNKIMLYGPAGTLLATGSLSVMGGVWYYIEAKIFVHDTSGVFECKVDGATQFTYSGDTKNATNTLNSVNITAAGTSLGTAWKVDDVYCLNSVGSANNTYLGEQRCEIMTPTSDSTVAWTHNTGASNWDAVNDAIGAPDNDTTYVSSSTSTAKDEYGLSDLSGVNAVAGVKLITCAEKDDANPLSFKHGIKSGATDQQVTYALGIGYVNYIDIFETSDGAGTAFTATTVNSLLSTIEVV